MLSSDLESLYLNGRWSVQDSCLCASAPAVSVAFKAVTGEVTFDIDVNGIVNVSAKDKATGKEQRITISGSTALDDSEIDRMVKDAERHAEEDKRQQELAESKNRADSLAYSLEQTLRETGDKVPAEAKSQAEAAISKAKSAIEGSDQAAIDAAIEDLNSAAHSVAEAIYGGQGGGYAQASQPTGEEDIEDAEYEVVDE